MSSTHIIYTIPSTFFNKWFGKIINGLTSTIYVVLVNCHKCHQIYHLEQSNSHHSLKTIGRYFVKHFFAEFFECHSV